MKAWLMHLPKLCLISLLLVNFRSKHFLLLYFSLYPFFWYFGTLVSSASNTVCFFKVDLKRATIKSRRRRSHSDKNWPWRRRKDEVPLRLLGWFDSTGPFKPSLRTTGGWARLSATGGDPSNEFFWMEELKREERWFWRERGEVLVGWCDLIPLPPFRGWVTYGGTGSTFTKSNRVIWPLMTVFRGLIGKQVENSPGSG